MSGGIIIARSLWDDAAFQNEPFSEREAWVWMIAEASWKSRQKRVGKVIVTIGRGQLAHSARFLADCWKWTHSKVRRFLERLEKLNMIDVQTDTGVSVITLCKYNEYQLSPQAIGTEAAQKRHRSGTNENKDEIRVKEGELDLGAVAPEKPRAQIADILSQVASAESVASFIAYRAKIKKPLTVTAAQRLATQLSEIMARRPRDCLGDWASDALGMAEEKGWQSIQADWYFNAKGSNNDNGNSKLSGSGPSGKGPTMGDALAFAAHRKAAQRSGSAGGGGGFI